MRLLDNTTGDEYTGLRYEKVPLEVAELWMWRWMMDYGGDRHCQAVSYPRAWPAPKGSGAQYPAAFFEAPLIPVQSKNVAKGAGLRL
ncbi:hypothetical protein M1O18_02060 [Dehalococcoidia bacterium]|nr:hypothetical protein [Dehalococcoidia bacterium]